MKILVVSSVYTATPMGGAERVAQMLAEGMQRRGHEVNVVTIGPVSESGVIGGVPVETTSLRNVYDLSATAKHTGAAKLVWHALDTANFGMAAQLKEVVLRTRPEVVHTHNVTGFSPLVWKTIAKLGVPVVHTLHDYYALCLRSSMYYRGRNCDSLHRSCRIFKVPTRQWSRYVTAVVGVSRFVLDRHRDFGAFDGVPASVVGNPVGANTHRPATVLPGAPLRLGFLGRIEQIKGIELLLEACASPAGRGTHLAVAGSGNEDYVTDLRRRYASDRIAFVGAVRSEAFHASLDVLVAPSLWHETFGLSILEAQSFGVPAIASNRGAFPALVTPGETGFLFEPDRPAELSNLIASLSARPEQLELMSAACIASAARFDIEKILSQYEAIYRSAIQTRASMDG